MKYYNKLQSRQFYLCNAFMMEPLYNMSVCCIPGHYLWQFLKSIRWLQGHDESVLLMSTCLCSMKWIHMFQYRNSKLILSLFRDSHHLGAWSKAGNFNLWGSKRKNKRTTERTHLIAFIKYLHKCLLFNTLFWIKLMKCPLSVQNNKKFKHENAFKIHTFMHLKYIYKYK